MENLKLLFVCGKNRLRSPTAEAIFAEYEGIDVDSAGIDRDAETPLGVATIQWADIVFVMEKPICGSCVPSSSQIPASITSE
jgi:predicted protein tyrosine phosphatase